LDDELAQIAKEILQQAPLLSHVSVEYLPQIGYLIAIQEQDQHFLPSTASPLPDGLHSVSSHGRQDLNSEDASSSFFSFVPSTLTEEQCHLQRDTQNPLHQAGVFPPEYQHIYTSEGIFFRFQ
jgi:hypothetical protein